MKFFDVLGANFKTIIPRCCFLFHRSNNPVLLRFLRSLRKAMDDNLLTELIIRILQHSQDLISPYLTGYQMVMDPHNTKQWLHNLIFIIKLYFHLSMPKSILKELAISADHLSTAKCLKIVCPENMKRNILTRGLQVGLYNINLLFLSLLKAKLWYKIS